MIGWGVVTGRAMLPKGRLWLRSLYLSKGSLRSTLFGLVYPWQSLPSGTTICDVGGGNGHAMLNLLKAFPHLRVVIQDLKAAVEDGQEVSISSPPSVFTRMYD